MSLRVGFIVSVSVFSGCAAANVGPSHPSAVSSLTVARFRTVHIDTIAPGRENQFEAARVEWLRTLAAHRTSDGRGVFVQVGGNTFFTLRPFAAFAELDGRGKARARALASVDPALRQRYDDQSDAVLVFPHRNEIWSVEESLGYRSSNGALTECSAGAGRLVVESLRTAPPFESQYEAIWGEMRAALQRLDYPLSRITYSSVFGDGRIYTFWLARDRAQLASAPTLERALTQVLGAEKASDLIRRQVECLAGTETFEVVPRPDLSNPEFCP